MKDTALHLALSLAGQMDLIPLLEDVESNQLTEVHVAGSPGFADDRELHDRVYGYIWSLDATPVLVPNGKPARHPLP